MSNKGWSIKNQEEFVLKVGELYANGYSIVEAVNLVSLHYSEKEKCNTIKMMELLNEGCSFHEVLRRFHFHGDVLSLLYFSQKHGDLSNALIKSSMLLKRKRKLKQKMLEIVRYPILLMVIVITMLFFINWVLLPQFILLFEQMKVTKSWFIQFTLIILSTAPTFITFFFLILLSLIILFHYSWKTLPILNKTQLLLKIPIVRNYFINYQTYFFAEQTSSLLQAGLSIKECLLVFESQTHHEYLSMLAKKMKSDLVDGKKFEDIVLSVPFLNNSLATVVIHGQKNGKLSQQLLDYSESLLQSQQKKLEKLLKRLQPILLMFVGLFIMFLYVSIFIPMLQLIGGL